MLLGSRHSRNLSGFVALGLVVLCVRSAARAALLTDFAGSYALYEACTMGLADTDMDGDVDGGDFLAWQRGMGAINQTSNMLGDADRNTVVNGIDHGFWKSKFGMTGGLPESVCFKLFFDPVGVVQGQVTAVLQVEDLGDPRLATGTAGIIQPHPAYNVTILNQSLITVPDQSQRLEIKVRFEARNPTNPPSGAVTIFGLQIPDRTPSAGVNSVQQIGFDFKAGDSITTFDTTNNQTTVFSDAVLQDVPLTLQRALLEPGDPVLAIDRSPLGSHSVYPPGQGPTAAFDNNPTTKYRNQGRRNTGVIVKASSGLPTVLQSMVLTTANDDAIGDPMTWQIFGTTDGILSGDNGAGNVENWTLLGGGFTNLPTQRGVNGPVLSFPNAQPYSAYRVVFPDIKDFRATTAMQIGEISLFASLNGTGAEFVPSMTQIPAFQLPTPDADSPLQNGPEKAIDGLAYTKYRNFGKELAGIIATPTVAGTTLVNGFAITTADDVPNRDPLQWQLYGTDDTITSQNFGQGNAENWFLIDLGTLNLPSARLEEGAFVKVVNPGVPYRSYRLVFTALKNSGAPGVDSLQISEVQFYGNVLLDPVVAVPEPSAIVLLAGAAAAVGVRRRVATRRR